MKNLETILGLNERLFINTLEGISEESFSNRMTEHNNSMEWIATHTIWARFNMLVFLGKPVKNPYDGLFEEFKAIESGKKYASMAEIKENWNKASSLLREALATVSDEHLKAEAPIKNPTGDFSNAGTLAFLVQHESYDIGQLGFLKKFYSKEAMKY